MKSFRAEPGGVFIGILDRGEDLFDGIIALCRDGRLRDAVIVEGHATLDPVVVNNVSSTGYPIEETLRTFSGPHELLSIGGLLVDGELHAHVTVADGDGAVGGHLVRGSRVLYSAEFVVLSLRTPGRGLTRVFEPRTNVRTIRSLD